MTTTSRHYALRKGRTLVPPTKHAATALSPVMQAVDADDFLGSPDGDQRPPIRAATCRPKPVRLALSSVRLSVPAFHAHAANP